MPEVSLMTVIVGTGFKGTPAKTAVAQMRPGDAVRLERENHPEDPLAVKCHYLGVEVGYIPRAANPRIAEALDAGLPVKLHRARTGCREIGPSGTVHPHRAETDRDLAAAMIAHPERLTLLRFPRRRRSARLMRVIFCGLGLASGSIIWWAFGEIILSSRL